MCRMYRHWWRMRCGFEENCLTLISVLENILISRPDSGAWSVSLIRRTYNIKSCAENSAVSIKKGVKNRTQAYDTQIPRSSASRANTISQWGVHYLSRQWCIIQSELFAITDIELVNQAMSHTCIGNIWWYRTWDKMELSVYIASNPNDQSVKH